MNQLERRLRNVETQNGVGHKFPFVWVRRRFDQTKEDAIAQHEAKYGPIPDGRGRMIVRTVVDPNAVT